METTEAVKKAKQYAREIFAEEGLSDLTLEGISFDDRHLVWNVTLGFSRTDGASPFLSALGASKRDYKIVRISDADGKLVSLDREKMQ